MFCVFCGLCGSLSSDEVVVVGEEFHVGDLASDEVGAAGLVVGLGTGELEDVDFAVFPAVAVEFLLALEEVALEFLEFDGLLVFVERSGVVGHVACAFLAEGEEVEPVLLVGVECDGMACDVGLASESPGE